MEKHRSKALEAMLEITQPYNAMEREVSQYDFIVGILNASDAAETLDAAMTHFRKLMEIAERAKKTDPYAQLRADMLAHKPACHLRVVK